MPPSTKLAVVKNNSNKIQLLRPTHARFEHSDLEKFHRFAIDFGFNEVARVEGKIYYGGYGKDPFCYIASQAPEPTKQPKFLGAAFVAASKEDFDKASKLPNAVVTELKDAPGRGVMVTISRPNGTWIHVTYGQQEKQIDEPSAQPPTATTNGLNAFNYPFVKPRRDHFQRLTDGPALVHKLGHFGYMTKDFDDEYAWYTSTFNFAPSDILHQPDNPDVDVLCFMHLDRGETYVDHHCMFLGRAAPDDDHTWLHHSSYEVNDYDEQMMGHQYLGRKGWESVWGVGRHILGSQIFDYWADPSGFKIEHYADGDIVNNKHVVTNEIAGPVSVWGPELPKNFGEDMTLIGYG